MNAVPDASAGGSAGGRVRRELEFVWVRGSLESGGPGAISADVRGRGQADDQRVAAHRAGPFLAIAVRDVGTGHRLRVKLLEQPLLIASCAVHSQTGPAQLRHPGDLLSAMRHGACES